MPRDLLAGLRRLRRLWLVEHHGRWRDRMARCPICGWPSPRWAFEPFWVAQGRVVRRGEASLACGHSVAWARTVGRLRARYGRHWWL